MLEKYLKKDGSLDYQRLYKAMEKITGFNAKSRREQHYVYVTTAYKAKTNPEVVPF
jgi:hypothetical protein|tara:strand:+ start:373 stop:540 length:168 start_codon:yes stop_codon:yes gene_type:complete